MRAAPRTSPFFASPLRTMSSVLRAISTRPSATATRSVTALAETSTMRASPRPLRWVSFFARFATVDLSGRSERGLARKQRARGGSHVVLAHQAFADEERQNAGRGEPRQVVGREDAALADGDPPGWNETRQP